MKKILAFIVFFLFVIQANIGVHASNDNAGNNSTNLYPFEYKEKWGYMDEKGNVKIEPMYDGADGYSDGLALVRKNIGKDDEGWDIIKFGYIDKDGTIAIPIRYDSATSFVNGNAIIVKFSKSASYDETGVLSGIRYWIKPSGKYFLKESIVDTSSLSIMSRSAYPFCDGLALIAFGWAGETYYIDTKGNTVFETTYEGYGFTVGSDFNEGLAVICTGALEEGAKFGYIDTKNKIAIPPKFENAGGFSEGLAPVYIGSKWGYINKSGAYAIPLMYESAQSFSDGIAAVKKGGLWGFINAKNEFVIKPQYKNVSSCVNGLIMVKSENSDFLYYVNKENTKIIPKLK